MITIPPASYYIVDIVIAAFYIAFLFLGAHRGFLRQLVSLLGTVLSFLGAWRYCGVLAEYIHLWPSAWNPAKDAFYGDTVYAMLNKMAWFFVLLIVLRLLFLLLDKLVKGIENIPVLKQISGLLGALLGAVGATVWVLVFCILLQTPLFSNGANIYRNTVLHTISETTGTVFSKLAVPVNETETFSKLYQSLKNNEGEDTQAIEQWLQEHGYSPQEENQ